MVAATALYIASMGLLGFLVSTALFLLFHHSVSGRETMGCDHQHCHPFSCGAVSAIRHAFACDAAIGIQCNG
jgi:hypothetical protein